MAIHRWWPSGVGPIEWELMDSRVQEFDHSQLFKEDVEKHPRRSYIQKNT